MALRSGVLNVHSDSELLSYIINVTPELSTEIDLPVQGESIKPIGKLIINNERYKNAFLNTINLIGLTIIKRNGWENPWDEFTNRGTLRFGQQIRELITDLANVYDYNQNALNVTRFLQNEVPNVYNYIHEVNFQKFYATTTSDEQMAMAFDSEGGLFDLVEQITASLYESWKYDKYIVDKYMLCRRIIDGTVPAQYIDGFNTMSTRERVSAIKNVSSLMTFRSANYNPTGIRKAVSFDDQIMILNTDFQAKLSTEVLATSFFRNDAEMKSRLALVDGFGNHDTERLAMLLGDAYIPFTGAELTALSNVPAVIISREWFMDYLYTLDNATDSLKQTDFYNPTNLKRNIFLHVWAVMSTSPFEPCAVFTLAEPSVTSVSVSPSTATVSKGQTLQLSSEVVTVGFANKAVVYSVVSGEGVTVNQEGLVTIPSDFSGETATIRATSIYDSTKYADATITVA